MMKKHCSLSALSLFALLLFGCSGFRQAALQQSQMAAARKTYPVLTLESNTIDYGTVKRGSPGDRMLRFTNTGGSPLSFKKIDTDCDCLSATYPQNPVQPGQSEFIRVEYDTKRVGRFEKIIMVIAEGAAQSITVKGNVLNEDGTDGSKIVVVMPQRPAPKKEDKLADLPNGMYRIGLKASGKVLDAAASTQNNAGGQVILWSDNWCKAMDYKNQKWRLKKMGKGLYQITVSSSGKALDAHSNDINNNGCKVHLWDRCDNGCGSQLWKIIEVGKHQYQVILEASGKALDAHGPDINKNGCRIQLYDRCANGCPNQVWVITQPGCL